MTRVWALAVRRSIADWASRVSAVMVSHLIGAGTCSLDQKLPASWAFQHPACRTDLQGEMALC
jgi:hypothetical protein